MPRLRALLVAVAVVAAACTGGASSSDPASPTASSPPPPTVGGAAPERPGAPGDTTGRILVVRDDAEIVVVDPADGSSSVINDPGSTDIARQAIWSPDASRVAWAAVDSFGGTSVRWTDVDGTAIEAAETPSLAFYLTFVDDGAGLAWLGNAADGVGLSLADPTAGTSRLVDVDVPYYLDALAGGPLIAHVGGVELRAIGDGDPERIGGGTPAMQAPEIAPDGTIIALVDDRGDRTIADAPGLVEVRGELGELRLVRLTPMGEEVEELVRLPREAFAFDLADEGDRIALWRRDLRGGTAVEVVDLATGLVESVVDEGGVAAAWSPDGTRLAVLVIEPEGRAHWAVWTADGLVRGASFRPTGTFVRDYLPFWDQYLRSSTPWSPDSAALTHTAVGEDGPEVRLQPADGSAATVLGAGEMSWWSPSSGRSPSRPVSP